MLKNGTFASPATARASSVLPVPGAPTSSTPFGIVPPRREYFSGFLQEVDDLDQLVLDLVDPGDVLEGDPRLLGVRVVAPGAAAPDAEDAAPRIRRRAAAEPEETADQQDRRPEIEQEREEAGAPRIERLCRDLHAILFQERLEAFLIHEARQRRRELRVLPRLLAIRRIRIGHRFLERPLEHVALAGDLGHILLRHLIAEEGVGDGDRSLDDAR